MVAPAVRSPQRCDRRAGTSTPVGHDQRCGRRQRSRPARAGGAGRGRRRGRSGLSTGRRRRSSRTWRARSGSTCWRRMPGAPSSIRSSRCRTPSSAPPRLRGGAWFAVAGDPLATDGRGRARWSSVRGGRRGSRRVPRGGGDRLEPSRRPARPGGTGRRRLPACPFEAYLDLVRATVENVAALGPARRAHRSGRAWRRRQRSPVISRRCPDERASALRRCSSEACRRLAACES